MWLRSTIGKIVLVSLSVCITIAESGGSNDDLLVTIRQGALRGFLDKSRKGREFLAFQGIPYALPPLGNLRFQKPEPAGSWSGVLDATKQGSACLQKDIYFQKEGLVGEEDCLYINVYTPKVNNKMPLPVMFWIHGGGWLSGSSTDELYGANYLLDKDVVLVTFNYRLGPIGFLSTGDAACPGNNGLKDQVLALKWVKENIAKFGGNPEQVTVFGQSAGGASSHYHTLSPLSKGLFHGAIAHSGTALCPWAFASREVAKGVGQKLATLLDCPITSSTEMVDCLRTRDAHDIIATDPHFRSWNMDPVIVFRPVAEDGEGAFLTDNPMELMQDTMNIANVPFIAGLTSGEGAICTATIFNSDKLLSEFDKNFDSLMPNAFLYGETSPDPEYVTKRIREFYFHNQPITNESRYTAVDMYTDGLFLLCVDETVRLQATANTAPVFYYYFDYKPPVSYTTVFGDPVKDYGVSHSDELQFFFPHGKLFPNAKLSELDYKVIDDVVTLWTDFARTGNPTPSGHHLAHWNPVKTSEVEYLHIRKDGEVSMHHSLLAQRAHFWATLPLTSHPYTSIRDEL